MLKADGILTVMFTHKATGAWDALTTGLMQAGFTITASWPINTEAEGSLHIKDKAAANSTIFLVCRPRAEVRGDTAYWEDVEPLVASAVAQRIAEYEAAGIRGVDLYLSCFGPALEAFAAHWPMRRGQPLPQPARRRGQPQAEADDWDPYAVTPEDALNAARREVKRTRLERLTHKKLQEPLDPLTEWYILAWDAFEAPQFPADEGAKLARVVGLDLEADVIGRVAEKRSSELILWDSSQRAARGVLGAPNGSQAALDALHHAAHRARTQNVEAGGKLLDDAGVGSDPKVLAALGALLNVLPVSRMFGGWPDDAPAVQGGASDFEALEKLRRLRYATAVVAPEQLVLNLAD